MYSKIHDFILAFKKNIPQLEHVSFEGCDDYSSFAQNQEPDANFFENFTALSWKQQNRRLQASREDEVDKAKSPPSEADILSPIIYKIGKKEWEELYVEVLYTVKHKLGASSSGYAAYADDLYDYAQKAFCITPENHRRLLAIAQEEKPPIPVLHVIVVEAQDLEAKDPNGFSDPYCMLGIQPEDTSESRRNSTDEDTDRGRGSPRRPGGLRKFGSSFRRREHSQTNVLAETLPAKFIRTTTVKSQTLTPKWNEKFCLDIDDIRSDKLHLDIWDHDGESSVFDAARKLNEISGLKGLGRYFKEIAQSARTSIGDNVDDFLGCVNISLEDIPSSGVDKWFQLRGRSNRSNIQGRIHIRIQLGTREERSGPEIGDDNWKEVIEHQQLLWIFVQHELTRHKSAPNKWSGVLPEQALTILHQHAIQGDISELQQSICQWIMYSRKHLEIALDYALLYQLLDELDRSWNEDEDLSQDEQAALTESFNLFMDYCMKLLVKQRHLFPPSNSHAWHKLKFILKCLNLLHNMVAFKKCCPFRNELHVEITNVLKSGTVDWFHTELAFNAPQIRTDHEVLKSLIDLIESLNKDQQKGVLHYSHLFESTVGVNYTVVTYKQLERLVEEEVAPMIQKVCDKIGSYNKCDQEDLIDTGTIVFELYLVLQEFIRFRENLPMREREHLAITNFHLWFSNAVHQWFTVAKIKARQRIQRAVELDKMKLMDSHVNYSSSAVDTKICFTQIRDFWNQLAWPDEVTSYPFVIKIIENICEGAVFYASLCQKHLVDAGYYDKGGEFDVLDQVCVTINNIDHILGEVQPIKDKLHTEDIIRAIESRNGEHYANQCRNTLHEVLKSTEEDMMSKIYGIINGIVEKMRPDIEKHIFHLAYSAEKLAVEKAIDPLMTYLDSNLKTLFSNLLYTNFNRLLEALWKIILQELTLKVREGIGKEKPAYFAKLSASLTILVNFFYGSGNGLPHSSIMNASYQELEHLLNLHKTESTRLIELYYIQKLEQQKEADAQYGFITVKVFYNSTTGSICVDVLNARELIPLDPNGFSDPFVIIELKPRHFFPNCPQKRTKIHKKTLFPLFDESFEFIASIEKCHHESAVVNFVVMDYDVATKNDFEGEAYLPLNSIARGHTDSLKDLRPEELNLTHPNLKNDILSVLAVRKWDKDAQEFVKQEKLKS